MIRRYRSDGAMMGDDLRVFVQSFATAPRMIIFGAIDFSAALAPLARELGYDVTICDARQPFLESGRFSRAAQVVNDWPDRYLAGQLLGERDAVLVFTHDPKFDEPALIAALHSGAGYIGALGSRRTQADRRRRLAEAGISSERLDRIVGPCGLDIGAATPMETAVSILAEIISRRAHRSGSPLTETSGSIRSQATPTVA
jgi:xanthine dehydrogenase accessory factor